MQTTLVVAFTTFFLTLSLGSLCLFLHKSDGTRPTSFWDAHATLNAINQLASQAETGKRINTELIYSTGEHLKYLAVLIENRGWLESQQLSEWIASAVGIHRHTQPREAATTLIDIQIPPNVLHIDAGKLTRIILSALNEDVLLRRISVIALGQKRPGFWRHFGRLRLRLQVASVEKPQSNVTVATPWRQTPDIVKNFTLNLSCEYRRSTRG